MANRKRKRPSLKQRPRKPAAEQEEAELRAGLKSGAIVAVDPAKVISRSAIPLVPEYYYDHEFTCKNCGTKEVWTAKQQKRWYEEQGGELETTAIKCRACRRQEKLRREEARRVHLLGLARKRKAFFRSPIQAESAVLSAYDCPSREGTFGIRIETKPLLFTDPDAKNELEPEINLEHLSLPSNDPAKLQNTRFTPGPEYEGSFYFLGEHNQIDLKEIRFLGANKNSLLAEYDLVIHLPKNPPNEHALTLRVKTEIQNRSPQLEPVRAVSGLGNLAQEKEHFWKGNGIYAGHAVEIEFYAEPAEFDELASFVRSTMSGHSLPSKRLYLAISAGLELLEWKLKERRVRTKIVAKEFKPLRFFITRSRRGHQPQIIIVLSHPKVAGHWSINFHEPYAPSLTWMPKGG